MDQSNSALQINNPDKLLIDDQTLYRRIQSYGDKPLAINPIGNHVGIGKANPSYTLDVNGDMNYSGALRKNGVDVLAGKQNTLTAGTGISISGSTISLTVLANMTLKYSITSTRTFFATNTWYNYFDISSVNSVVTCGQNLKMFQLTFINSTDFGNTNIVIGRFNLRISDFAGLKWQNDSDFILQNCSGLTVTNFNQIRVTTTFSTTLQAYITSIV